MVELTTMKTLLTLCLVLFTASGIAVQAATPKKPTTPAKKKEVKPEKVDPAAFMKKFDEDKDGKLDKKELSTGLRSLKSNSITTKNDSWKRFDTDGDGKLDLKELTKLLEENK
jgi:hypothetical protein